MQKDDGWPALLTDSVDSWYNRVKIPLLGSLGRQRSRLLGGGSSFLWGEP